MSLNRAGLARGLLSLVHVLGRILLTLSVSLLVGGCSIQSPARQTLLPSTQPVQSSSSAVPRVIRFLGLPLEPEAGSVPATLKDNDSSRVIGDYAYVDLEAVLKIFGRIPPVDHEVTNVRFFERIAAAVTIGNNFSWDVYLFSKDIDGVWQIVGRQNYVQ